MSSSFAFHDQDHYAVLGVPPTANDKEIRKAYLKLSLEHHPDKNPDNVESAQTAFVCIGQAYQVLSDPQQRAEYNKVYCRSYNNNNHHSSNQSRPAGTTPQPNNPSPNNNASSTGTRSSRPSHGRDDFASGFAFNDNNNNNFYSNMNGTSSSKSSNNYSNSNNMPPQQQQQQYDSYKDAFEATMADLSEDEVRDFSGAAAMLGGIVGTIVGSRFFKDHPILKTVGPTVASAVASQAAASAVRASHATSKKKALAIQDRKDRMARGEPVSLDEERESNTAGDHLREIIKDLVQNSAAEIGKTIQQAAIDMISNKNGATKASRH